jgi:hypothetical protein
MYDQVVGNKAVKARDGEIIDILLTVRCYGFNFIPINISMPQGIEPGVRECLCQLCNRGSTERSFVSPVAHVYASTFRDLLKTYPISSGVQYGPELLTGGHCV